MLVYPQGKNQPKAYRKNCDNKHKPKLNRYSQTGSKMRLPAT